MAVAFFSGPKNAVYVYEGKYINNDASSGVMALSKSHVAHSVKLSRAVCGVQPPHLRPRLKEISYVRILFSFSARLYAVLNTAFFSGKFRVGPICYRVYP